MLKLYIFCINMKQNYDENYGETVNEESLVRK